MNAVDAGASLPANPPPPSGCRLLAQSEVTSAISAWATDILKGPLALFDAVDGVFTVGNRTGTPLVAWLNVHPPDFQNHVRHRGVTVFEQVGDVTGVDILPMPAEGIDVSHHQEHVDWNLVAATPALYWRKKLYAFMKASEGISFVDEAFIDNWREASGLLKRGAYHFLHSGEDAGAQVTQFLSQLNGDVGELPFMVDVEPYQMNGRWVTPTEAEVRNFIDVLTQTTASRPILYIGDVLLKTLNLQDVPAYIMIAHYGVRVPTAPSYNFHQYSQSGTCPGIATEVDLQRFHGGADNFDAWVVSA